MNPKNEQEYLDQLEGEYDEQAMLALGYEDGEPVRGFEEGENGYGE